MLHRYEGNVTYCAGWGTVGSSVEGWTVQFLCDNQAVVSVWFPGSSQQMTIWHMHLLRALFFAEAKFQFTAVTQHIPGVHTTVADALSRNHLSTIRSLIPQVLRHLRWSHCHC